MCPPGGGGGVVEFWSRSDPQDLDLGPNLCSLCSVTPRASLDLSKFQEDNGALLTPPVHGQTE